MVVAQYFYNTVDNQALLVCVHMGGNCPSITLLLTCAITKYHVDMSMTSYVALINPLCNIARAYLQLFVYNYYRVLAAVNM